jgi:hypothetical protein
MSIGQSEHQQFAQQTALQLFGPETILMPRADKSITTTGRDPATFAVPIKSDTIPYNPASLALQRKGCREESICYLELHPTDWSGCPALGFAGAPAVLAWENVLNALLVYDGIQCGGKRIATSSVGKWELLPSSLRCTLQSISHHFRCAHRVVVMCDG